MYSNASNIRKQPVMVLLYHRITNFQANSNPLVVTPGNFNEHIRYLKRNYKIIRFDDDWTMLDEPAIVITFDDGYFDNYTNALPILEDYEVPATFFITSHYVGTNNEFWWDEIDRIISYSNNRGKFTYKSFSWNTSTKLQQAKFYDNIFYMMMGMDHIQREELRTELLKWSGLSRSGRQEFMPMTKAELIKLAKSKITTIGSHTSHHSQLSALTPEQQKQTILDSKKRLESIIGEKVTTFAYPFGKKSHYNAASRSILRELGFKKAASNFEGRWLRGSGNFQIPRFVIYNWDIRAFARNISSFWWK